MVKKTKKGDVMTRFWYTLKNLDPIQYYKIIIFIIGFKQKV
jgi:hypothetical protein